MVLGNRNHTVCRNQTKTELAVFVTKEDLNVENEKNEMKMNKNSWQWSGKGDHQ